MRKGYKLPMIPPRGDEFRVVVVESETPYDPPRGDEFRVVVVESETPYDPPRGDENISFFKNPLLGGVRGGLLIKLYH